MKLLLISRCSRPLCSSQPTTPTHPHPPPQGEQARHAQETPETTRTPPTAPARPHRNTTRHHDTTQTTRRTGPCYLRTQQCAKRSTRRTPTHQTFQNHEPHPHTTHPLSQGHAPQRRRTAERTHQPADATRHLSIDIPPMSYPPRNKRPRYELTPASHTPTTQDERNET